MNIREEYRIDSDSFPSFFSQIKETNNISFKDEALSISFENENFGSSSNDQESLKNKLKTIEFENKRLMVDLEASNHRFSKEKEAYITQVKEAKDSENKIREELITIKEECLKYRKKNQECENKHGFIESQVEFLTKENKRLTEQYKIDKENWELKLENLKKSAKTEDKDDYKTLISLNKAEAKIKEQNNEISELKSKNEYQKLNYQKKIDFVEGEIRKLKQEEEKYIKELEIKNKDNEEIILQLKTKIKDIEKSLEKKPFDKKVTKTPAKKAEKSIEKASSLFEKLSKSTKSPLIQSPKAHPKSLIPSKRSFSNIKESFSSKELKKKPPSSRDARIERYSNMPTTRLHNKTPSYLAKENQSTQIEALEKEIAVLTGRYKYLLQMSQDALDLLSLRSEINKIAADIEEKSNQLYALKKKQQDYLKEKIKN